MAPVNDQPAGDRSRLLERFPCSSRTTGFVALAGLAVAIVLVVIDGQSVGHWAVVAALLLLALGAWLTMVRPTVSAHEDHLLVRNALTDTTVPWHLVESVEVRQVLVIRTEAHTVHGIAVGRSARQQLRQRRRGTGPSSASGGMSAPGVPEMRGSESGGHGVGSGGQERRGDYASMVAQRLSNLIAMNRRESMRLSALDKQWRWAEVVAVVGVAAAFALLVILALA